jgi:hypothetical protein
MLGSLSHLLVPCSYTSSQYVTFTSRLSYLCISFQARRELRPFSSFALQEQPGWVQQTSVLEYRSLRTPSSAAAIFVIDLRDRILMTTPVFNNDWSVRPSNRMPQRQPWKLARIVSPSLSWRLRGKVPAGGPFVRYNCDHSVIATDSRETTNKVEVVMSLTDPRLSRLMGWTG